MQLVGFMVRRLTFQIRRDVRKSVFGVSDQVQRKPPSEKKATSLEFRTFEEEKLYYPCSENKGADQLCSFCTADLRLCFRVGKIRVCHNVAHILYDEKKNMGSFKKRISFFDVRGAIESQWVASKVNEPRGGLCKLC